MEINVGDIVTIGARPEKWAVLEITRATPSGVMQCLIGRYPHAGGAPTSHQISASALTVVAIPVFVAGQIVRFGLDQIGEVVEERDGCVTVAHTEIRKLADTGRLTIPFQTPVQRGWLVRDNIAGILRLTEE